MTSSQTIKYRGVFQFESKSALYAVDVRKRFTPRAPSFTKFDAPKSSLGKL